MVLKVKERVVHKSVSRSIFTNTAWASDNGTAVYFKKEISAEKDWGKVNGKRPLCTHQFLHWKVTTEAGGTPVLHIQKAASQ